MYQIQGFVYAACALLTVLATTAQADVMVYDDLWDISQGTTLTTHGGVLAASDARNMFGYNGGGSEPGSMLFDDQKSAGSVHSIEWHTVSPVRIESFNLVAAHDQNAADRRAFSQFDLFAWTGTEWALLYTCATNRPYGGGAYYVDTHFLELKDDVDTVMTAQDFRAEFVQRGDDSMARGPRILELDGFGTIAPEPGTLGLLLLIGLVFFKRQYSCLPRR